MIRSLPFFLDVSTFTAHFVVKHRAHMAAGELYLRGLDEDGVEVVDRPILKDWKSARALLLRIRNEAAKVFDGKVPTLGRVWLETLPPDSTTPWVSSDEDDLLRLRICLIPSPLAYSFSGSAQMVLAVGSVNLVEHRLPCSEINLGSVARTHLIVDVVKPDAAEEPA